MPTGLEDVAAIIGISVEEVKKEGLRALLEKELRTIRTEILATCQKYGVRSWEGMNQLIVEDKIEEGIILDDFQHVDHLTAQAKRLQELLERV
ncbi:MAG TPA: hypothetical protein VLK82_09190 [Candidatus Tectomicrobia bacterium]|nr:hypothetical protein [Candidatus Tectomicrobia bacterium]